MKLCKNCAYITEFGTFVDYFEVTTYADDWIRAAFAGRETSFPRNGNVDFTGFSPKARTGKPRCFSVVRFVWAFVISSYLISSLPFVRFCVIFL